MKALVYRKKPLNFISSVEVAACYIECQGKILLLKRALNKPQGGTWGVPAGKVEVGETPYNAVVRETFEEVGLKIAKDSLHDLGRLYVRHPDLDFIYHSYFYTLENFEKINLSDEHTEYRWISIDEAYEMPLIGGGLEALYHFKALKNCVHLPKKPFYFIRHGETDQNANPDIKRVDYDLPLNNKGMLQAESAKEKLNKIPFKHIFTSPIQRAQQTKEIITQKWDVIHFNIDNLSECKADIWTEMVKREKGNGYLPSDSVESFLSGISEGITHVSTYEGPSLIVGHGGTFWAICYLLMIDTSSWKIGNCQPVLISPDNSGTWKAEEV